jgi:hypothetical protein
VGDNVDREDRVVEVAPEVREDREDRAWECASEFHRDRCFFFIQMLSRNLNSLKSRFLKSPSWPNL